MPEFEDGYGLGKRELDVRKKILRDYNKRLEDFDDEEKYNDYLEQIEEIIFNLVNGVDIDKTNEQIRNYRIANAYLIGKNKEKKSAEDKAEGELLDRERREREQKLRKFREDDLLAEQERRKKLQEEETAELEKLEKGDKKKKKKKDKKEKKKKHKEGRGRGDSEDDLAKGYRPNPNFGRPMDPNMAAVPFVQEPFAAAPVPQQMNPEDKARPVDPTLRASAGGFTPAIPERRAWEEVKFSLFL
mmetsp:Transcript_18962/g.76106  ORF Transcript_18962/g.76106 Transcript_18962/m.76106 type:complete len:244 (-) Transcript_18962:1904-2635(-)